MPRGQVDVMTERLQFVPDARQRLLSFTELCALSGVSRVTGYKWLHRAKQSGLDFLQELSRRPHDVRTRPRRSRLCFGRMKLGWFHEGLRRVEDTRGRLARKTMYLDCSQTIYLDRAGRSQHGVWR